MDRVVELGTGESDRTLANQIARSDITKLYLMSELLLLLFAVLVFFGFFVFFVFCFFALLLLLHHTMLSPGYYWTILAMTTVGNLPHPTTKVFFTATLKFGPQISI